MKGNSNDGMCCQSWLILISSSQYLQYKTTGNPKKVSRQYILKVLFLELKILTTYKVS